MKYILLEIQREQVMSLYVEVPDDFNIRKFEDHRLHNIDLEKMAEEQNEWETTTGTDEDIENGVEVLGTVSVSCYEAQDNKYFKLSDYLRKIT